MTKKEILEYNKLCAEFLTIYEEKENELQAYPEQQYSPLCSYANSAYSFDKEDNVITTVWGYCKFHSDWNWIMEVVEAIEKLDFSKTGYSWEDEYGIHYNNEGTSVEIGNNTCFIYENLALDPIHVYVDVKAETKKKAVVQAINSFLIWYNKNK